MVLDENSIVHIGIEEVDERPIVTPIAVTKAQAEEIRKEKKNEKPKPEIPSIESKLIKPLRYVNVFVLDFVSKSYRMYPDVDSYKEYFNEYHLNRNFIYSTKEDSVRFAMRGFNKFARWLLHPRLGVIFFKKGEPEPYTREQFITELGPELILYDQATNKIVTSSKGKDMDNVVVLKNTANSSPMLMKIIATTNLYEQWVNNMDVDLKKKAIGKTWLWIVAIIVIVIVAVVIITQTGILDSIVQGA